MIKFPQMAQDKQRALTARAQSAIEYGLIAALVAVAVLSPLSRQGGQLNTAVAKAKTATESASG